MIPRANEDFEDHDDDDPRLTPRTGEISDAGDPQRTPTSIDLVNPLHSSTTLHGLSVELSGLSIKLSDDLAIPHATQLSVDPPTTIVRRGNFRELPPGTIVGENYEVGARLGAGAMGEVYAARHVGLGKRVAIKVIVQRLSEDDRAIERFVTEARVLAQIQHPSIVAVEHVGELPDGRAYFVMEHLRGESLSERLSRGPIPLREALRILDQMARGLEAAHGSGVIHRDLKPDNTFLVHLTGEKPAVKLLDFGLAKLAATHAEIDQRAERSESGIAIGTPLYMSPEQARGPDVDHRTDIYALGCVAYELILGVRPFPQAKSAPEIYAEHLHGTPSRPRSIWPEIPPQLDLVLFTMLAKGPMERPTLAQLRSVIANLRLSTPSQQVAPMRIEPRRPKRTRRATIVALAITALATGASLGAEIGTTINSKRHATQLTPGQLPMMPGQLPMMPSGSAFETSASDTRVRSESLNIPIYAPIKASPAPIKRAAPPLTAPRATAGATAPPRVPPPSTPGADVTTPPITAPRATAGVTASPRVPPPSTPGAGVTAPPSTAPRVTAGATAPPRVPPPSTPRAEKTALVPTVPAETSLSPPPIDQSQTMNPFNNPHRVNP